METVNILQAVQVQQQQQQQVGDSTNINASFDIS